MLRLPLAASGRPVSSIALPCQPPPAPPLPLPLPQVDAAGAYSSPIPSVAQRFGTMVGGLTTGRMLIAQGAIDACKIGLTIAIRYSANRPQVRCQPAAV